MENGDKGGIYRKAALDKLSHVDQFDAAVRVINPFGWLLLLTGFAVLLLALMWGVFGSVSYKVQGQGMLIAEGGLYNITSVAQGQLESIEVSEGDFVEVGDTIAFVDQSSLEDRIAGQEKQLSELQNRHEQLHELGEKGFEAQRIFLEQKQKSIQRSLSLSRKQKKIYQDKIEDQTFLLEKGLITQNTLNSTSQGYLQFLDEEAGRKNELKSISAQLAGLSKGMEEQSYALEREISAKKLRIENQKKQLEQNSRIVSRRRGRVIETKLSAGDYVSAGTPVVSAESVEYPQKLKAVIYIPVYEGKKVRRGMQMLITPSTVKKEEYGAIEGRVTKVSTFPATPQSMEQVLRNTKLVQTLSAYGAPNEIVGELVVDADTPSGYRWSSGRGPNQEIYSGTFCNAQVRVGKERPIFLLLPFLKKFLG